jgi:hypothetical protein
VTNGSASVVGVTGSFLSFIPGEEIVIDGTAQIITSITDATHLTLTGGFTGSTGSGVAWAGSLQRFRFRRLGASRDRVFSISITDAKNLIRIVAAYLGAEPGTES